MNTVSPVFVGRTTESGRLHAALARARAGEPAVVLLGGEAGLGKSRLLTEFHAAHADTLRLLLGGRVGLGADGLPFAPFIAALRGLAAELTDTERTALAPLLPGRPGPGTETGEEARPRLFEGMLALLARLAGQGPAMLVVEDAHWADRSSRDLLDFLVRNQRGAPGSLIVVTYRAEELDRTHPLRGLLTELGRMPWAERIELAGLSRTEVLAQARNILAEEPDPQLVGALHRRSEGNPLFVEALLDGGRGDVAGLPAALADLLLAGVDRLGERAALVVRAAAVSAELAGHTLLDRVCDLPADQLATAIRAAVAANVLVVAGDGYLFRHALIREAVYRNLLPGERIGLHARYAEVLGAEPELSAAARPATELAHHLFEAREAGAMSAAWAAAAEAALRAGENVRGEELATAALAELDAGAERVRTAAMLERRGQLRTQAGGAGALADLREAVGLAPETSPIRGFLLNSLAERLMEVPLPGEAREAAERALAMAHRTGDDPTESSALITLAVLDARLGDLDGQLPRFARARAIAETIRAHRVRMRAWAAESSLLQAFGRLTEAETLAREGLAAARAAGLSRSDGAVHAINLAGPLISAGRWEEAVESIGYALDLAPPPNPLAHLLCLKALVSLHRGDLELGERLVDRARELLGPRAGFTQDPSQLPRLTAQLRLAQGRHAEAAATVREALDAPDLTAASRFTWPLLVIGAEVAGAAQDRELLAELRDQAARMRGRPARRGARRRAAAGQGVRAGHPGPHSTGHGPRRPRRRGTAPARAVGLSRCPGQAHPVRSGNKAGASCVLSGLSPRLVPGRPESPAGSAPGESIMSRILGIVGSLRQDSFNRRLLDAARHELGPGAELVDWTGLRHLPPFDQDAEAGPVPAAVAELRREVTAADGLLVITPEYNGSIPGQLKNAIDWASRPHGAGMLTGKPAAVLGASPSPHGAAWAQDELAKVLGIAGATVVGTGLPVPEVHRQFDERHRLLDHELRTGLAAVLRGLREGIDGLVGAG
ncbi:NAD(P)H-dependent oxidoreductase [Amycolatopsis aidingensis]|uniref:NAD(P)H-dependent oxidoreductase n=1 Tax=Amycolatopsis aidingensis TaxID=2842453 RepID=UPI001C0B6605|nr:NAD(P)H-dependent oxidoreductase [Amycolatopsis aidingensis]